MTCLLLGLAPARAAERPIVVELFTSQGCSSCPPAEALLGELAARPDLLALSLHVDYWDRLGWKDPFSSPAATERQRRYARSLGLASVYTPQLVVDGNWQAVGSDRAEVTEALARAARDRREVPVLLAVAGRVARIDIPAAANGKPAAILLVGFDRKHETAVPRGENAGRSLAETDIVRGLERIGRFDSKPTQIAAPIGWPCERVAVLLQQEDGRIVGAAAADVGTR